MPFIIQERRKIINEEGIEGLDFIQPGDRCYKFYKVMVNKWKVNPRWSTAHEIYKEIIGIDISRRLFHSMYGSRNEEELDDYTSRLLAWQVFFQLYVIPYELKKKEENGDI